jgi:hypothetical protein
LLTAEPPPRHGVYNNGQYRLPAAATTLAEVLAQADFQCVAVVSTEVLLAKYGLDQGFESYDDRFAESRRSARRPAEATTEVALRWLQSERRQQPFFLWVHYYDAHLPYAVPPDLRGRFARPYHAQIHHMDRNLGKLLDELLKQGVLDRTLVCVTADHGEGLGEHGESAHGSFVYESTQRVPLLLVHPGLPRLRVPDPVSLEDVAPTLLEAVGVAGLTGRGRSLMPLLRGETRPTTAVYLETFLPYLSFGWSPLQGVIHEDWKYIDAPDPELYQLQQDPQEKRNRFAEDPERVASLRALLGEIRSSPHPGTPMHQNRAPSETARLEQLGYVVAASAESLPLPGSSAGADPKSRTAVLGLLYQLLNARVAGRGAEIQRLSEQVLQHDPDNPLALRSLGLEFLHQDRLDAALDLLGRLHAKGRSTPESRLGLGLAHLRRGQLKEAREHMLSCSTSPPTRIRALRWLGELEEQAGDLEAALQRYQELLAEFEGPPAARQQIEERVRLLQRGESLAEAR